jgi:hypothetical protein
MRLPEMAAGPVLIASIFLAIFDFIKTSLLFLGGL